MNLPVSLLVFDETQSAFLSAVIMVCGMLPDVLLPVLAAPLIDKGGKKKWIVGMDALLAVLYVVMGVWISKNSFSFGVYVAFTLLAERYLSLPAGLPGVVPRSDPGRGEAEGLCGERDGLPDRPGGVGAVCHISV